MNGRFIPDTPIMVDLWRRTINPSSKLYFLSHMHSDHTAGLSASWRWPIHCSPITAKLLVEKFQIRVDLIRPLELNTSHIIKLDHSGKETMTVTLFNANHCPGSVMFLFEGYFGRVLYTGDFRYDPATFPTSFVGPEQPVDRLYLDNTFNNPRCKFPSRSCCKKRILEILHEHPEHEIVLAIYTLGKEDLLVDIALALQTRIVVSQSRMNMLQLLALRDVFTTDENRGRVRLVRRQAISRKNMTKWNAEAPTIAIIPTGLFSTLDGHPYANQDDVFTVPYSDHSSYPELLEFVSRVCPRAIYPIVRDSNFMNSNRSVADMHNFDHLMDRSPSMPFNIPPSVQYHMSSDFSNPINLIGSGFHHRKFMKLKRVRSGNRRSNPCAMGVVYEDDHDGEEEKEAEGKAKEEAATGSSNSPEKIQCKLDQQEQQLGNHDIIEISSPSVVMTIKSGNKQKDEALNQSSEAWNDGYCLLREGGKTEYDTNETQSRSNSRECTTNLLPNWDKMNTNLASGKKDLFNKIRKRKLTAGENSSGQGQEAGLIQTMSTKRSRTLPPSFVVTPKTEMEQSSGLKLNSSKLSSFRTLTDFFPKLNVKTQAVEKSDSVLVESEQTSSNAHLASIPDKKKSRTNEQSLIPTTHKPNHDCESTKSTFSKLKSDVNFTSSFCKRHTCSEKSKLTPVSTLNEKEALESLTAAQETKCKSERVTASFPLTSSRHLLNSLPSETPFNHLVVTKRKYTKDVSEYHKRIKLAEALDKFI